MFLIAFKNHGCCDEILCLLRCDIGVYPKGANIIFSLTLLCFSITFNIKRAFDPEKPWFASHQIKIDNGMVMTGGGVSAALRGRKAYILFWWYRNVQVLLLIRGERYLRGIKLEWHPDTEVVRLQAEVLDGLMWGLWFVLQLCLPPCEQNTGKEQQKSALRKGYESATKA